MVWADQTLSKFPKGCADDGSVVIPDLAVAFVDGESDVFAVDGKVAAFELTLETADGSLDATYDVLMVAGS